MTALISSLCFYHIQYQPTFLTTIMHFIIFTCTLFLPLGGKKKKKVHSLNLSGSISKTLKLDLFARIRSETPVTAGKLHKCTLFLLLDLLQSTQWCSKQRNCFFFFFWREGKKGTGLGIHQQTCPSAINKYSRPSMSGLRKENNLFPIIS